MASNRAVVAAAWLLGTGLVVALPGVGLEAARAGSEAEPHVVAQPDASPAQADRLFRVEWSAGASGRGQSRIVGYVHNDYGEDAVNVQLRIRQLDDSGRPVSSIIQPVGDTVHAGGRAFFDMRVPGNGPSYQVAVASFDFTADREWKTLTTEQLLAAAGFQKKVADSPRNSPISRRSRRCESWSPTGGMVIATTCTRIPRCASACTSGLRRSTSSCSKSRWSCIATRCSLSRRTTTRSSGTSGRLDPGSSCEGRASAIWAPAAGGPDP